jgi:hypothetical protein
MAIRPEVTCKTAPASKTEAAGEAFARPKVRPDNTGQRGIFEKGLGMSG